MLGKKYVYSLCPQLHFAKPLHRFSEIPASKLTVSAPVIQHPDIPDEPAYKVEILQAGPAPLPVSVTTTPAASHAATPRSEPIPATRYLTVHEVTSIFLKSLVQSAEDFLGKKIDGAVITVPIWFTDAQKVALKNAASDAGVRILQLLEEAGAAAVTTTSGPKEPTLADDRIQLVVDLGASSLELALLAIRQGLAYVLATASDDTVGGDAIDDKLIKYFAKEFTKKTKTPLTVAPATDKQDRRAEAKFRLSIEHTKRTLSASPGAATCSVESVKDGLDFNGTVNRLRFDMEVRSIYERVYTKVQELVHGAGLDLYDVDEIVYVGGSASLPGLDETLSRGFSESVVTPFTAGTVVGGGIGDPTTILSRGCVLQAKLLATLAESTDADREIKSAFASSSSTKATSKTIGLIFPEGGSEGPLGGQYIPLIHKQTPLPCRRTIRFDVDLGESENEKKVGFEVWEVQESVKITQEKPPKLDDDEDEEDEDMEIEVKDKTVEKVSLLSSILLVANAAQKKDGRWKTNLEVQFIIHVDGSTDITTKEVSSGQTVTSKTPAAA